MPKPPPRARVFEDDATILGKVEDASIDAVITSPPYVATYDYLQHHELRLRWLGLDARKLARGEIGARRNYLKLGAREATASWEGELAKLFKSLARVMKRDASLVLLIADSAQMTPRGAIAIRADDVVARVADKLGSLVPVAAASQARPHFHAPTQAAFRERPRYEHALLLTRR
jgi:DNA modification methylase